MPHLSRRRLGRGALGAALAAPLAARAQDIQRDVRIIVPYAPGGSVDILARLLAEALVPVLSGRHAVVENRSGAGGLIGMQAVANSPPDGHALCIAPGSVLAIGPVLPGMVMPIDPDRDLTPISNLISVPMVLVARPNAPYDDLAGFIAHARRNRMLIGNSGNGSVTHLLVERISVEAGGGLLIDYVPYRGGTPALLDVLAGQIECYFSLLPESINFIRQGQMKPIFTANPARLPVLPNVAAVAETFPGYRGSAWYGMVGPGGLPPAWQTFWAERLRDALATPAVQARFATLQFENVAGTAAEFRADIARDRAVWAQVIQRAGIRVEG